MYQNETLSVKHDLSLHAVWQTLFFDVEPDFPARSCMRGGKFAAGVGQGADFDVVALDLVPKLGQLVDLEIALGTTK